MPRTYPYCNDKKHTDYRHYVRIIILKKSQCSKDPYNGKVKNINSVSEISVLTEII